MHGSDRMILRKDAAKRAATFPNRLAYVQINCTNGTSWEKWKPMLSPAQSRRLPRRSRWFTLALTVI
jgi:hypothetical protein